MSARVTRLSALIGLLVLASCGDPPTGVLHDAAEGERLTAPHLAALSDGAGGDAAPTAGGAQVWTDKEDYHPGELVTIMGSGWWPDETVHIHIEEEPETDHNPHDFYVQADGDGNWVHAELVMDEEHLGVTFYVTATGGSSGQVATIIFTDGAPTVNSFELGIDGVFEGHPVTVGPGGTVSIRVNATTLDTPSGSAFWRSTQVQFRGGSIGFGDSPPGHCNDETVVGVSTVTTEDHTFSFAAPETEGTYDVRVRAFQNDGCSTGPSGNRTLEAVLTVQSDEQPRATTTSVTCTPGTLPFNDTTTCTATVADAEDDGNEVTPGGTVELASDLGGSFSNPGATCTLSGSEGVATCSVDFTPSEIGTHDITAGYSPTSDHVASDNENHPFELSVTRRATTTSVTCDPTTLAINEETTCTVTVEDTSDGTKETPVGTVTFSSDGTGAFDPTNAQCTLDEVDGEPGKAECDVDYVPGAAGAHEITASFAQSDDHFASDNGEDAEALTVTKRQTSTTVQCEESSVVVNEESKCTVRVEDLSGGTAITPTGTVSFASDQTGEFDPAAGQCTLAEVDGETGKAECNVDYTPGIAGIHEITASFPESALHRASDNEDDPFELSVAKRTTTTVLECVPSVQQVEQLTRCTATVTDVEEAGSSAEPEGVVTFFRSAEAEATCELNGEGDGEGSSCFVDLTSEEAVVDEVTAVYDVAEVSGVHESSESLPEMIVFFDPSAGFVTGGGWIWSEPGAYAGDLTLEGRANFGFVSRYQRGATVPTGNTQFQFRAGDLNFHSTEYEWLVIAGARAQFRGEGRLNGVEGYGFMLTAIDGDQNGGGGVDRFRIKIWNGDGEVTYDNHMGMDDSGDPTTSLGGGSIQIQQDARGRRP
jgi:hypothetical protein